jgi:serine/threonine protein kinase
MKIGDRVLSYIIESELGEGGMGTVYLGRHTALDQFVAIKSLSPMLARDEALRARFLQEANIQAKLRHPGIVQVLTADMESEQPSLVLEYIEGKSLSEVLEIRGALPIEDALKIMEQVISAVGYAHRQGVVHRDLKPSNVMVMANGEAKVTDFGIAKVLGSSKLTRTGTAMGSAHYMSPEQIRRPETVDARSDIYSLGCVFYEVLTGQPPFGEKDASGTESDFEIKEGHVRGQIPALHSLRPDIPDWLVQVVMAMLEKDTDKRPSSCEMTLERLKAENVVEKVQVGTKKEDAPAGKIDREQNAKGSSQENAIGSEEKQVDKPFKKAALAIVVLIVVAFVFFIQSNKTPSDQQVSNTTETPVPPAEKIVVAIAKQAEQLKLKIEAGNPNGLAQCAPNENLRFDKCWGSRREAGDGGTYVGEFKEGNKHGLGTYTWTDGEQYVGEWSYGKRSGKGIQTKANGEKYVGEYFNGFFHGKGIKYASNGNVIESGIYKNGHLVKSQ